ncbi:hypothetical protein AB4Z18_00185 [Leifsonia sp. 2TAF2]|uniref:hypothetical protein n=1 Tax=Leifsonia sp. 2TAF2 TaxID=3233009 RepID=UPI003F9E8368
MTRYMLRVNGQRPIPIAEEIGEVKERIVAAVRSGGDFVTVTSPSGDVELLISPGLPVTIDAAPQADDELADASAAGASGAAPAFPAFDDFDDWGI